MIFLLVDAAVEGCVDAEGAIDHLAIQDRLDGRFDEAPERAHGR